MELSVREALSGITTVQDMVRAFQDEDRCRRLLEAMVWPNGRICPACGYRRSIALMGRENGKCARPGLYRCSDGTCRFQFTVTTRTPLHATKLPLRVWLSSLWLMLQSDKGISSIRLAEALGVSQPTAWRMGHALRLMVGREQALDGVVEIDGLYVGGKPRLRLCGPGEWLVEKHGTRTRRSWRKLHIGVDAETGQILAAELTTSEVADGSQVEPLLDQIPGPLASFTGDGAYDQTGIYDTIAKRYPEADVIVPPRSTAVLTETAESTPTQRDRHLQSIAEHGRTGWQTRSGYTRRALVEAAISRLKRVIGDALRSRTDRRRLTEVAIAIAALNRMLELGRPKSVRIT